MLLPVNRQEMAAHDWSYLDFLLLSGDAYVDHASFGPAVIGRYLESLGYRVGILAQPRLDEAAFKEMGRPGLAVLVTAGNLDSLLAHYTASKNPRKIDKYSPGGKSNRPDYAVNVYAEMARKAFGPDMPIILGGIEASLRRFAHYDYWQDKVLPSVLYSSVADLLVYGMGELAIKEIAAILKEGGSVTDCRNIDGIAYLSEEAARGTWVLPAYEEVAQDKKAFARAFKKIDEEQNFFDGKTLAQRHGDKYVLINKPMRPLSTEEIDAVYSLPFERRWHPSYDKLGGVPAFDEVRFSLVSHRGCFGGCSFCALNVHQGRIIQTRSRESLLEEAKKLTALPDFKGNINDVGGPTANFRGQVCKKAMKVGPCRDKRCLYPRICHNLPLDSGEYEGTLTALRRVPGVKKVFVRSGLRYDYALAEKSRSFLHTLCRYHISGQLKVAPEHISPGVLQAMGKGAPKTYFDFVREYRQINKKLNKEQYLVPYFMSSHPGSTLKDAVLLADYMKKADCHPEQVQDFIPTPGSKSTCMYYTGLDPDTMRPIPVARTEKEKAMQRALLQDQLPQYQELAEDARNLAGKTRSQSEEKKPKAASPAKKTDKSRPQAQGKEIKEGLPPNRTGKTRSQTEENKFKKALPPKRTDKNKKSVPKRREKK